MKALQISLEQGYATKENMERIAQLTPGAKTAVFSVEPRYPLIRKVRGIFRRVLPFYLYDRLVKVIDPPSEAQKLLWIEPPVSSLDTENILLLPPGLGGEVTERLLNQCRPHWVHSLTAGLDRIPALPKATLLTSSRGVHSRRIAEFVLGLIFAVAKNIPEHSLQTRNRSWKTLPSMTIRGSRLGIVGLGSIGKEVARLGKAMDMEVWATKRKLTDVDFVDRLIPPTGLPSLLCEADYLVMSVPLTQETRNLIGKVELSMMKPSSYLINVSRGGVIDQDSLYQALKNSQIRGACIDVFQNERPLPRNSRFYRLPNLLVTSYSAYYSTDYLNQLMDRFFENLSRFKEGQPLAHEADQLPGALQRPTSE